MTQHSSTQFILFLLQNLGTEHRSFQSLLAVDEKKLERLALENKCIPCLFHCIKCRNCRQYLSAQFISRIEKQYSRSVHMTLLYEQQKKELLAAFQKKKLSFCFLKDFSSYPKVAHHAKYFWSSDLDLLVTPENFFQAEKVLIKMGYKKITVHEHEAVFRKNGGLEVDLHSLPCDFSVNFQLLSRQALEKLSRIMLSSFHSKKGQTSKEIFLLFLIVHFWVNDCLKRIRPLYDIATFIKKYHRDIDWQKFISAANDLRFLRQIAFVMDLCSRQFSTPMPRQLKDVKKGFVFSTLMQYHNSEQIMNFPPTKQWWKPNNKESRQMHAECYLTSLLLQQTNIMKIISKPRVALFFLKILMY